MTKSNKYIIILSIGLVISFFLPWINLGYFQLSGFQLATPLEKDHLGIELINKDGNNFIVIFFYLIPLCSIWSIISFISGKKTTLILSEFLAGIVASITFYVYLIQVNEKLVSLLSLGYYLTAFFSLLGVAACIMQPKSTSGDNIESTAQISENQPTEPDRSKLLDRLNQLHDLKEKSVIDTDLYEQERLHILSQLKDRPYIKANEAQNQASVSEPVIETDIQPETFSDNVLEKEFTEYPEAARSHSRSRTTIIIILALAIIGGGYTWYHITNNKAKAATEAISLDAKNSVNIDGKMYSIRLLRKIDHQNVVDTFIDESLNKPISIEVSDENHSIALTKVFDDGFILTNENDNKENEVTYRQTFYSTENTETKAGKMFWAVNSFYGGSASGTTVYLIQSNNSKLTCDSIFNYSPAISICLFSKKKNEILLLDAIWTEGESHFEAHKYNIIKYNFDGATITKRNIGSTSSKYGGEENNMSDEEITQEILKKETRFSQAIRISDYRLK